MAQPSCTGTRKGKFLAALVLLVLLGVGTLAWLERTTLLAWYHVRMLTQATEENRESLASRVAVLEEAALPGLYANLHESDPDCCLNVRAGLAALAAKWGGISNARTVDMTLALAREFPTLSTPGKQQVLELLAGWFRKDAAAPCSGTMLTCARMLSAATGTTEPEVQGAALELCAVLVSRAECPEILSTGRELVRACLAGNDKKVRLRAIQVALFPGMDLLETVAGLLVDSEVEVRRAAILAVGPADKVVLDETLLPCLCDKDDEVRLTCEMALKGRGLKPEHLEMARLSVDKDPRERLRVLDRLRRSADLDAGIWLRRLSHDPAPSVRAAAIRAMRQQPGVNLTDRIDQMAQSDPSPTVCYLAAIYLKQCRAAAQTEAGQEER
jgi:HEAT repeat associated with sister chromatid cohesion